MASGPSIPKSRDITCVHEGACCWITGEWVWKCAPMSSIWGSSAECEITDHPCIYLPLLAVTKCRNQSQSCKIKQILSHNGGSPSCWEAENQASGMVPESESPSCGETKNQTESMVPGAGRWELASSKQAWAREKTRVRWSYSPSKSAASDLLPPTKSHS